MSKPKLRITVGILKGGGGRSTTTVNLAFAASLADPAARILVVDADPRNGSTYEWAEDSIEGGTWPSNIDVQFWPVSGLTRRIEKADVEYDHIFVDTGNDSDILAAALDATNHLVIPLAASHRDMQRVNPTMRVALPYAEPRQLALSVLLVKTRYNSVNARMIRTVLVERKLPVLRTEIPFLDKFASQSSGPRSVLDISPYDAALQEILDVEAER